MLKMSPDFAAYEAEKQRFLKMNDLFPEQRRDAVMRQLIIEGTTFEQFRDMLDGADHWKDTLKPYFLAIQRTVPRVDPFIQGFTRGD